MKSNRDIIGLPVFSIIDGREIGHVKDLVINPDEGAIEYLLVEHWFVGERILPFKDVIGIGDQAVTTESESLLLNISNSKTRGLMINGMRVLTRKGNLIGKVSSYDIDENTGKMLSLHLNVIDGEGDAGIIKADDVLTYGTDVMVVQENNTPASSGQGLQTVETRITESPIGETSISTKATSDAARLFIEKQKEFLRGKVASRDVMDDKGNIIIPRGTVLDDEHLNLAEQYGKLVELP